MKISNFILGIALLLLLGGGMALAEVDIVIAVPDNHISMDPHDSNDNLSYSAQMTMMQGLLGFDRDMNVIPVLAESYQGNSAATVFTFKLRRGIRFHDGEPFNAQAVKINIERLADPANKLKRHSLFAMVKQVEVVDDYTVRILLKEPFGAMTSNFAHPCAKMHSPKALAEYGKEVSQHPVGTGPYMFQEWVPGDHVRVVKNNNYWQPGQPKADSITIKPVPENGSRIAMLRTGEADFIYPVPTEQVERLKKDKNLAIQVSPSIIVNYVAMNNLKKPFDDIRVRRALNYAVNRRAYMAVVLNGYGDTVDSIIAPNVQHYAKQTPYTYDLARAKRLLKEAGYEKGFTVDIWGNNNSNTIKGLEFIQQQLAPLNIKVNVIPMESGTRAQRLWSVKNPQDAEVRLYYAGWSPSTGDADWGIRPLFAGFSFPPASYNVSYYSNGEADRLIKAALETADQAERKKIYAQAQSLIWDECPWIFLAVPQVTAGRRANVKGAYRLADGTYSAEYVERIK